MGNTLSLKLDRKKESFSVVVPEDIIRDHILIRLPVKSLVRFRCVCKSWNSLLSDPDFAISHLTPRRNNYNDTGMIVRWIFGGVPKCFVRPVTFTSLELAGSINGLVCVYDLKHYRYRYKSVGIWNPATNQYKDIPLPSSATNNSCGFFGLGFDSITNDYKVIYAYFHQDLPVEVHVYSCNSDCWYKNKVTSTALARGNHSRCPTILHGCPYWYNYNVKTADHYYVTYFDMRHDVFRFLPGIPFVDPFKQHLKLVNLRDSLAVLFYDHVQRGSSTTSRSVNVYIFDESLGVWCNKHKIGPITIPSFMPLLGCFRNGDLVFTSDKYLRVVSVDYQTQAINRFDSRMYEYYTSCSLLVPTYSFDYRYKGGGMYEYDDIRQLREKKRHLPIHFRCIRIQSYSCDYIESLISVKGMKQMFVRKVESNVLIIDKSL